MEKAGFWTDKMVEMASQENDDNKMSEVFDKLDLLIIYMMRYREALIEKWLEQWEETKLPEERNNMREEIAERFPTIRLLMTINRDIQLAMLFEKNKDICFSTSSTNTVFPIATMSDKDSSGSDKELWYKDYYEHQKRMCAHKKGYFDKRII